MCIQMFEIYYYCLENNIERNISIVVILIIVSFMFYDASFFVDCSNIHGIMFD